MAPSKPAYDVDWIFSNNSDVHVANHRDWFTSYTPFTTSFNGLFGAGGVEVLGIGDVELPVKTHPTRHGAAHRGTITLRTVLHAPSATCNIIGYPILKELNCKIELGGGGEIVSRDTGARLGIFDSVKLFRLRLQGQSATQTSLDKNSVYIMRANWDPAERARWDSYKAGLSGKQHESPPLTAEEKQWVKKHYGNEHNFLLSYGLKIFNEEDRDEGRVILRALMQED